MKELKDSLVFGRHPVVEVIRSGRSIDQLWLQRGTTGPFEKEIRSLCREYNIPLKMVPKERLAKLTRSNHQGVVALLAPIPYYRLSDVLPMIYEQSQVPLLLMLDGVTDVRNFGSIARSAVCGGVDAIIIPEKGTARINADALKTSAGALTKISVCREGSLVNALDYLQQSGVQVFASSLDTARRQMKLQNLDLTQPTAFVIGAEDSGVSPHLLRKADQRFLIPQTDAADSYNVAVAAGIMVYEAMRQRG